MQDGWQRPLLAGTFAVSLMAAWPALAQQPAASPASGSPLYGRPETEGAMRLAPIAPLPVPAPADKLPVAKLKAPAGFKVEIWASGIPNARTMRLGDDGTVFVGNRFAGKVFAVVDKDGKRQVKTIAEGLHRPNGLAFHKGTLYVAELSKVWKFIAVGPDNKLYIPVGAPCNICAPPDTHAQIRRINLDGSGMEVVARGVRNTVGFDWHPTTKELWFTDNGRDWMSEDVPEDELNRITRTGQHFGFPFCHQGNIADNEQGWGRSCDEFVKPAALLGPHSAALGMRFYTGGMFPSKYKSQIFIARHGSWNRTKKVGGDVVVATLDGKGNVKSVAPFLTGFLEDNKYVARPVDVLVMKDGSMLVSDDFNGAIYRVSYGKSRTAAR